MGIISSAMLHSWEEMGCLDNDNSEELEQLKAENDKLKSCLQDIKVIAESAMAKQQEYKKDFEQILDLITKVESEG